MKALLGLLRIAVLLISILGVAALAVSLLVVVLHIIRGIPLSKSETITTYGKFILMWLIITPISIFTFIRLGKKIKG